MTGNDAAHHLAQHGDMILRLGNALCSLYAERGQIFPHLGERALMQETGKIVGGIGQQLAAADADEKAEELVSHLLRCSAAGRDAEPDMGHAQRAGVAFDAGQACQ